MLADIRDAADIKVLAALKAFSMWSTAPIVGEYLDGVCTSGLWEARLASEFYDGEIATYSAAYKPEELEEVLRLSDHVIFNSPGQLERAALILDRARSTGQDFDPPDDLVEATTAFFGTLITDDLRAVGSFGPEVEVPEDASALDRLLGFCGRTP